MPSEVGRDGRGLRSPIGCRSSVAGHHAHHIQWNQARRDPDTRRPAEIVEIGDEHLTVALDGDRLVMWHHDLHRVRELAARSDGQLTAQLRWSLLWFDTYLISVSREPLAPCSLERTGGALARATTSDEVVVPLLGELPWDVCLLQEVTTPSWSRPRLCSVHNRGVAL